MYVTTSQDHLPARAPDSRRLKGAIRIARTVTLAAGQTLFREGDVAPSVYEISSGIVRLTRVTENGRRQIIAFGYPGDIVGFPCCGRYHAECDALVPTTLVPMRADVLDDPAISPALHATLVAAALREIRLMQDHFLMLGRKSAREKLASFIDVLARRVGHATRAGAVVDLPMSRADIADFLGLTTETVSRGFTQLREAGIIALRGPHRVVILDTARLRAQTECD